MDQSTNGRSPTAVEIDGIVIDLNRISLRRFMSVMKSIEAAGDDYEKRCELSGELAALIVTKWPFDQPISKDGYLDLGLYDTRRIDAAITAVNQSIGKKKSESPSISLESTNNK